MSSWFVCCVRKQREEKNEEEKWSWVFRGFIICGGDECECV